MQSIIIGNFLIYDPFDPGEAIALGQDDSKIYISNRGEGDAGSFDKAEFEKMITKFYEENF